MAYGGDYEEQQEKNNYLKINERGGKIKRVNNND